MDERRMRSLDDDETVQEGDIIKDLASGEYRLISNGSFDGLLVGLSTRFARRQDGVSDVLRPHS